jgi:cobalt/nickel transport system permease protein
MHIPDGYLSPGTSVTLYAVMVPLWAAASRVMKKTLSVRQVPLLAMSAAFSFLIMMFNVPIAGGTTGHAVGSTLVAIILGPWAACISVSIALVIQALLFGDGGISALGANCFNMAFVMPFVGYYVYKAVSAGSPANATRRWVAAGIAGYVSLVVASAVAAFEFGIQPALAHDESGRALYCPYSLGTALAAMVGEHLLVFGWVEAIVTGLVVAFLGRTEPDLVKWTRPDTAILAKPARILVALAVLILATPVGLILPEVFKAGDAWGEWSPEDLGKAVGYIPKGLEKLSELWSAPLPDYSIKALETLGLPGSSLAYVISAIVGVAVCAALLVGLGRLAFRGGKNAAHPRRQ